MAEEELDFDELEEEEEPEPHDRRIPIEERVRCNRLPFKLSSKLKDILDGFKWAINKKNQSAVIVVDGRSGMGKTTLSAQIASYMSANFNLDHVYYNPETFLNAMVKPEKGTTLIFDEAMLLSSRSALSAVNKMIVQAMSMIRSKNLCIIFNVNSIFDLDRNLVLSRADLVLHVYGDSLTDKGKFMAFFKGADGQDRIKNLYLYGKKLYSYDFPKSNFNTRFAKHFPLDENEYERRKQEGVNKFLSGSQSKIANRNLQTRDKAIRALYSTGNYTQDQISEMVGLSPRAVFAIIHDQPEP
jgi:ABC-type dipeptide/oligopeptide/nickel transport system ATPase subunit